MIALGPLAFAAPLALLGLFALPLLWMVLRATPPSPREVVFAPLALLRRIARTPETPQSTPLWLIVLRLFLAALVILALARPVWQPEAELGEDLPLLVVVDDGWAAAAGWRAVGAEAQGRLERAAVDGRQAALVFTAEPEETAETVRFGDAREALARLQAAEPRPWPGNRIFAAERIEAAFAQAGAPARAEILWLADGLAGSDDGDVSRRLAAHGPLTVMVPPAEDSPLALRPAQPTEAGFEAELVRADTRGARTADVVAIAADGQALARGEAVFEDGAATARFTARLPLDLRNQMRLIRIEGEASAGAVQLADDAWRHPRVGVIEPAGGEQDQPLLSDLHYVGEALAPHAELWRDTLDDLLEAGPAVLVMVDAARTEDARLADFVTGGGVLIRFAGPRLAARGDDLLPVPLRSGGRLFGGAMAWDEPQQLDAFGEDSPFAGLAVPADVMVTRQVLAEPGPALDSHVWARLRDGTPLVTAERRGEGWIVLFHVTAGPDWSNLPLSGLYPAMLRRVLALAGSGAAAVPAEGAWQIERQLSGTGRLVAPSGLAEPVAADGLARAEASPQTPPGLWRLGAASAALNVIGPQTAIAPLARELPGAHVVTRDGTRELRLAGPLLAFALLLFAADMIIALALSGRLPALRRGLASLAVAAFALPLMLSEARAQDAAISDAEAMDRALAVRFGYVLTGNAEIDRISQAGLEGLAATLFARTAIEPGEPRGIEIESEPILFYPMIYWPVTEDAPALSPNAAARVEAYLQSGGLIVFDTRDAGTVAVRREPHPGLVRVLDAIDVPPLARIPPDHVLGRTFYLLESFPGRYAGGEVWVEADPDGSSRDGTSGVVIGAADWASAWAIAPDGTALAPVEGGERQRELALRTGVNLAMYALTGNYKADQVHVPAILERLGQD